MAAAPHLPLPLRSPTACSRAEACRNTLVSFLATTKTYFCTQPTLLIQLKRKLLRVHEVPDLQLLLQLTLEPLG